MSNPISGNHHDLFDIEIHFEEVSSILDEAKISTEGLFMNFDVGFDSEKLRDIVEKKGIIANICQNERNKNQQMGRSIILMLNYTKNVTLLKEATLGWIVFVRF